MLSSVQATRETDGEPLLLSLQVTTPTTYCFTPAVILLSAVHMYRSGAWTWTIWRKIQSLILSLRHNLDQPMKWKPNIGFKADVMFTKMINRFRRFNILTFVKYFLSYIKKIASISSPFEAHQKYRFLSPVAKKYLHGKVGCFEKIVCVHMESNNVWEKQEGGQRGEAEAGQPSGPLTWCVALVPTLVMETSGLANIKRLYSSIYSSQRESERKKISHLCANNEREEKGVVITRTRWPPWLY